MPAATGLRALRGLMDITLPTRLAANRQLSSKGRVRSVRGMSDVRHW